MEGQESRGSERAAAKDRVGERRSSGGRREKGTGWQKGGRPRGEAEGESTSHGLSCLTTSDQKHCWANYHPDDCNCCGEQDSRGSLFFSIYSELNSMYSCAKAPLHRMLAEYRVNAR